MTIVLTGGGSGGHITPLLAVAAELKQTHPTARLIYIGQRGDHLGDIPAEDPNIDASYTVRAGKFRRYHGEGLRQLLDLPTLALNLRDAVYVLIGLVQSYRLLRQLKPDMLFVKGGFVGVPVGLAAAMLRIPYVTHDSDAIPGLANRIIARWATRHAVALPKEVYHYPANKTVTTGIPLQASIIPVTKELKSRYRDELEVPQTARLLCIVGGGLGSQRINQAVAEALPHLLREFPDLFVVHGVGRANEAAMHEDYADRLTVTELRRVKVFGYVPDVYRYSGAADLVVTRAGATSLAEFAVQAKACLVIPSPFLTGGHQLKNAQYLEAKGAIAVIDEQLVEADPNRLAKQVSELLQQPSQLDQLARHLNEFAKPRATQELAKLILNVAENAAKERREAV